MKCLSNLCKNLRWTHYTLCRNAQNRTEKATGIGFLVMGFIGFFVKLIHIPVSNILMGG
eukprot:UN03463